MRLLAALAVFGALGAFGAASAPANAQVYPPVTFSLLCETGVEFIVEEGVGTVTVTVLDSNTNQPVPNIQVIFSSSAGSVSPNPVTTNSQGVAETTLDPGSATGPITVTASLQDTSCNSFFQREESQTLSEVAEVSEVVALPATGSAGASGGSSTPWALVSFAALGLVALVSVGRKVVSH